MVTDLIIPSNAMLQEIAQDKLPQLTMDDPIFSIMPMRNLDEALLMWEQKDNYKGLQNLRGYNGQPTRIAVTGGKRYTVLPGVYGEFEPIDEVRLTTRRAYGSFGTPVNASDLIMEAQDKLLQRRIDRIRYIGWTLLATGTFSVSGPAGVVHTDTFSLQTYSAPVTWATHATAGPLADFRATNLLSRGHSVNFGPKATAYANQTTINDLLANTNQADIAGKRTGGFGTFTTLREMNALFTMDGLPNIVPYDEGYFDESGTFQLFIPNGKVLLVGARRNGDPVGEYLFTRNANNPGMASGPYMETIVPDQIPRLPQVHDGHNGGPALYYPSAIVLMSV